MKKYTIKHINIDYYYHKLNNGLRVYLIPLKKKQIRANFVTFYGSKHQIFRTSKEKKYTKTPAGIAHFLEHKLFENEKISPFKFFAKTGTICNAYTSYDQTAYHFTGPFGFKKNISYLLDNVQSVYLTDNNVLKEKGIIKQEIRMRDNNPHISLFDNMMDSICYHYGIKNSIIGDESDIDRITKDILLKCYHCFYHPKNMFLVISGNINPEETISIIEQNQASKKFDDDFKMQVFEKKEPDQVKLKKKMLYKNVEVPKVSLNYKINVENMNLTEAKKRIYFNLYCNAKLGWSSKLNVDLVNQNLIEDDLGHYCFYEKDHIILNIFIETSHLRKVINMVKKRIENFDIDENLFERKKKALLSYYLYLPDKVSEINDLFVKSIVAQGDFDPNIIEKVKSINYQEFNSYFSNLNLEHNNYVIVKKDLQKK